MAVRITCVNKDAGNHFDRHHAITHFGWLNESTGATGKSTRLEIYDFLKAGSDAYVVDRRGDKAFLFPRISSAGTKFVQTQADGVWSDNLLALPECR
jgi:hypothetical protein